MSTDLLAQVAALGGKVAPRIASVLVVSHDHPERSPGGGELCAYQLFRSLDALEGMEATFLFAGDELPRGSGCGSPVAPYRDRPREYAFKARSHGPFRTSYAPFGDRRRWNGAFELGFRRFLSDLAPDVVHFHHSFRIGLDLIRLTRSELPGALICLTLHDYKLVCPDNGYMLRRHERRSDSGIRELCSSPSPARCGECCSSRGAAELRRRLEFVRAATGEIDLFFAPSAFLAERHVAWGLPAERVVHVESAVDRPAHPAGARAGPAHDRFGFFGRAIEPKGLRVFLEAALLLGEALDPAPSFVVNSPIDPEEDAEIADLAALLRRRLGPRFELRGGYAPAEVADRMSSVDWVVVPSTWWENSPFVIQEAFLNGRPVICSGVGGMAEHVRDGVDGLHFRVGDSSDLATTMRRAASEDGLWERLHANAPSVPSVEQHRDRTLLEYERLSRL